MSPLLESQGPVLWVTLAYLALYYLFMLNGLRVKRRLYRECRARGERFDRYGGRYPELLAADRVQLNTLEQLVMFIPAMFTYAWFVSPAWVLLPGGIFLLGRFLYARAYVKDPSRRLPGFRLTILANAWLIIGTFIGLASRLLA